MPLILPLARLVEAVIRVLAAFVCLVVVGCSSADGRPTDVSSTSTRQDPKEVENGEFIYAWGTGFGAHGIDAERTVYTPQALRVDLNTAAPVYITDITFEDAHDLVVVEAFIVSGDPDIAGYRKMGPADYAPFDYFPLPSAGGVELHEGYAFGITFALAPGARTGSSRNIRIDFRTGGVNHFVRFPAIRSLCTLDSDIAAGRESPECKSEEALLHDDSTIVES